MSRDRDDDGKNDISRHFKRLTDNPLNDLRELRTRVKRIEEKFRDQRYTYIGLIAAVYKKIEDSPLYQHELLELMEIEGRPTDLPNRKFCLLAFRYVMGARESGTLYERARRFSNVAFDALSKDIEPEQIPNFIRDAGGVEKLCAKRKKKGGGESESVPPLNEPEATASPGSQEFSSADDDNETDNNELLNKSRSSQSPRTLAAENKITSKVESNLKRHTVPFNRKTDLIVNFPSSDDLYDFLEAGDGMRMIEVVIRANGDDAVSVTAINWRSD